MLKLLIRLLGDGHYTGIDTTGKSHFAPQQHKVNTRSILWWGCGGGVGVWGGGWVCVCVCVGGGGGATRVCFLICKQNSSALKIETKY